MKWFLGKNKKNQVDSVEYMKKLISQHEYIRVLEWLSYNQTDEIDKNGIVNEAEQFYLNQVKYAQSKEDMNDIYRLLCQVAEHAGKFIDAAQIAESKLQDYEYASLLYEKANMFNDALKLTSSQGAVKENMGRQAELHEKNGSFLDAAQIYESMEQFEKASELYSEIGKYAIAAECYSKCSNVSDEKLAMLYEKAEMFEDAIRLYYSNGSLENLEKAYMLAKSNGLIFHEKRVQEKLDLFEKDSEDEIIGLLQNIETVVKSKYSDCLGIDFGTTNSVGAIFCIPTKNVEIIRNDENVEGVYLPSYFAIDENNKPLFGEKARIRAWTNPNSALARVKRSIGKKISFNIGSKQYKPEQVSAMIINKIKANAENYVNQEILEELQKQVADRKIYCSKEQVSQIYFGNLDGMVFKDVVLTVPAFYNDNQKRATRDAAEVAGLNVKRLMHEPTAACLAYGYSDDIEGNIVVVDFGGGTLDISLVDVGEGIYDVKAIDGDIELGGSDIDESIVQYALEKLQKEYGNNFVNGIQKDQENRLRNACEEIKINLSQKDYSSISLYNFIGSETYEMSMSRSELESIAEPVLRKLKMKLIAFSNEYKKYPFDKVIFVGNATKMPAVKRIAEEVFKTDVLDSKDVGTIVAAGAVIQGAIINQLVDQTLLLDAVPYSLGIAIVNRNSLSHERDEVIETLIPKNTSIPVQKTDVYSTNKDNQENVWLRIYQGESKKIEENYCLGAFVLDEIEKAPKGIPQIEVDFSIGMDCILTVTAKDKGSGKEQQIRIDGAVNLSTSEKNNLSTFFKRTEKISSTEKELENAASKYELEHLRCQEWIEKTNTLIAEFNEMFHSAIEINANSYKTTQSQVNNIQDIFMRRESIILCLKDLSRRIAIIQQEYEKIMRIKVNYDDVGAVDVASDKKNRIVQQYQQLQEIQARIEIEVYNVIEKWITLLDELELDPDRVDALVVLRSYMRKGEVKKAELFLDERMDAQHMSQEIFLLSLRVYRKTGNREKYVELQKKYGYLFDYLYPDFNHLDLYLEKIRDSIVMLISTENDTMVSGSGFAIGKKVIVTNKHVVLGRNKESFRVIGKDRQAKIVSWKIDGTNDVAVLEVSEEFAPFRLGDNNFVRQGSSVIAVGFPNIESDNFEDNIFISQGQINAIKKMEGCTERVFCVDAKLNHGISGGPLINELGEVVGINTMRLNLNEDDHYNIALPVSVLSKYFNYD